MAVSAFGCDFGSSWRQHFFLPVALAVMGAFGILGGGEGGAAQLLHPGGKT